jgi:hypothetical protein
MPRAGEECVYCWPFWISEVRPGRTEMFAAHQVIFFAVMRGGRAMRAQVIS